MTYKIKLKNQEIAYCIKKNARSKCLRISVSSAEKITVTMPKYLPKALAKNFLFKNTDWLLQKLAHFQNNCKPTYGRADYLAQKKEAGRIILDRLQKINEIYAYPFRRVSIRNPKTRWGSCSAKGNLNFSYRLAFLPEALRDYIIAHELCHLGEMNHSPRFWKLVEKAVPDYLARRRELRKLSLVN